MINYDNRLVDFSHEQYGDQNLRSRNLTIVTAAQTKTEQNAGFGRMKWMLVDVRLCTNITCWRKTWWILIVQTDIWYINVLIYLESRYGCEFTDYRGGISYDTICVIHQYFAVCILQVLYHSAGRSSNVDSVQHAQLQMIIACGF